mgnify:CR=1 FL=1
MAPWTEHGSGGGTSGLMAVTEETQTASPSEEETAGFGKLKPFQSCDGRKLHQSDFGSSLRTLMLRWCSD